MWNYIKFDLLKDVAFYDVRARDQKLMYYAWFQAVGFNRFDGMPLYVFMERTSSVQQLLTATAGGDRVRISRELPDNWDEARFALRLTTQCHPDRCGMLLLHQGICYCFSHLSSFIARRDVLHAFLDQAKVPSRVLSYLRMGGDVPHGNFTCRANCTMQIPRFGDASVLSTWKMTSASDTVFD